MVLLFAVEIMTAILPMYRGYQLLGDSQLLRFSMQLLGYEKEVHQRCIGYCTSGETISGLLDKIVQQVYPLGTRVILLIGTNDIKSNVYLAPVLKKLYGELVNELKKRCNKVVLLTVPPVPLIANNKTHWFVLNSLNEFIKQLAKYSVFVVDLGNYFIGTDNTVLLEYFERIMGSNHRKDLIHLNKRGFMILERLLNLQYFNSPT